MIYDIYSVALDHLKFFKNITTEFNMRAVTMLKKRCFYQGDYLLKENDYVEEMFFLIKGVLRLEKETDLNKIYILDLFMNEHFGDVYMNLNIRSPIDLKVITKKAELFIMTKADFTILSQEFPSQIKSIIKIAIINTTKLELRLRKRFKKHKTKLGFYEDMKNFQSVLKKFDRQKLEVENSVLEETKLKLNSPSNKVHELPEIKEEEEVSYNFPSPLIKQKKLRKYDIIGQFES